MKIIALMLTVSLFCFLLASCTKDNSNPPGQNIQTHPQSDAESLGDKSVFGILHSKCREAINDAHDFDNWKTSDDKGAKIACKMFDKYLSDGKWNYDKLRFITEPSASYYFMIAYLERELTVIRAIDIKTGVVEHHVEGSLEKFAKEIRVLDTTENARRLAKMFHCFHAGSTMSLVTEHQKASWRAEQNLPKLKKNEDGSMTLVYDLVNTGRSISVKQCTVNITADYKVTLECKEKEKNNINHI